MKRETFKIASLVLVLITASFAWLSCTSKTTSTTAPQVATVQRGNITTVISGSGNLAFSDKQDLAFGQSGQVAQINVRVGDNITQGQVLAKLDTTDLEAAVDSSNLSVQSAQISMTVAQNNKSNITNQEFSVQSAEMSLVTAQQAQSSINSAQISLETATNSLTKISYPYTYSTFALDIPAALVALHDAQLRLAEAAAALQPGSTVNYGDAIIKFNQAQNSLTQAEQRLSRGADVGAFVKDVSVFPSDNSTRASPWATTDFWTLRAAQLAVTQAQANLDQAKNSYKTGLDTANLNLAKAQQALADAKNSYATGLQQANVSLSTARNNLVKAQRNLAEAVITVPFSGIVTAVNISAGQLVGSGQVAITIADPAKLEADVLVNEIDIPWVTEGGKATLQVDAVSALSIPATVTEIAPTATVQSGVVNYTVTIGVSSVVVNPTQTGPATPRPPTGTGPSGGRTPAVRPSPSGAPSTIKLRQGLSVTASVVKEQKTGVLLVPSRAISQQGTSSYVQAIKSDGTTEQRIVQTGLTDGVNTEITSGLSEGDKILAQARSTATTTPAGGGIIRPGGGFRIGG